VMGLGWIIWLFIGPRFVLARPATPPGATVAPVGT
jgi:hypothetical protein